MRKSEKKERTLNAKLFVRILPTLDFNYDSIKIESNKKVLYVRCLQDLKKGAKLKAPHYWSFSTDGIFWNSCQFEVYETVTYGLFNELFDGVSALILCYGQTGSGKTFTASGLRFQYTNRGLILRILSQLFEEREKRKDMTNISLGMSYVEFIGETIRDLISNKHIQNVRNVVEYPLLNEAWAWKQIFNSECRKLYSDTAPYKGSNRGHSVLTFYTHAESLIDTDPVITHSKIHIVDMGGIDSLGNKSSEFRNKLDLGNSNVSKSLMEQLILCLMGTTWPHKGHICPYKSSRFLSYLHDTLQAKCLVRFIAHIYGNDSNLPITISALKFGERIRSLKPKKLEQLYELNCNVYVKNIEKELLQLRDEIELTGMLRDSPDYCNLSQDKYHQIHRAAEGFLLGQLEDLTLLSLGHARLTLEVFREFYHRLSSEKDQLIKDAVAAATDMLHSQMAERNPASNMSTISAFQKFSRRKSRQHDSQAHFSAAFRSPDSSQIAVAKTASSIPAVGVTDRKGISIGPGKMGSTYEGNITKAFKKLRSKKSDSLTIKITKPTTTRELGVPSSKSQLQDDDLDLSLIHMIPEKDEAWDSFCGENVELSNRLIETLNKQRDAGHEAKKNYKLALAELAEIRRDVEEYKTELEKCNHIRQIYGRKEEFEEDGQPVVGDVEKNLKENLTEKEALLWKAVEKCHVGLMEYRNIAEQLSETTRNLEETFQTFCKDRYSIVYPPPDEFTLSETKSGDQSGEVQMEIDVKNEKRMKLYLKLRQKLINYVPKDSKREWTKLF